MDNENNMLSVLDQAYIGVLASDEPDEELELDYYDLFLNSVLYVPTHKMNEEERESVSADDIAILPVVIEDEERQYIMLFDSKDRLKEWADGEAFEAVEMRGCDAINIFGVENYHMMLNVMSEHQKEFSLEEIQFLLSNIREED